MMASNRPFTKEERIEALQKCYKALHKVPKRDEYVHWRLNLDEPTKAPSVYHYSHHGGWDFHLLCAGMIPLSADLSWSHAEVKDIYVVETSQVAKWLKKHGLDIGQPLQSAYNGVLAGYVHRILKEEVQYVPFIFVDRLATYFRDTGAFYDGSLAVIRNPLLPKEVHDSFDTFSRYLEMD